MPVQGIVTTVAGQVVIAVSAAEDIIVRLPVQLVITVIAFESIVAAGTVEEVGLITTVKDINPTAPVKHVDTFIAPGR
ncbi:MAG: hypothetical protein CMJ45_14515 [Planctomyces sp.]|nr:hypothetical protein [Planctomyces sp.]